MEAQSFANDFNFLRRQKSAVCALSAVVSLKRWTRPSSRKFKRVPVVQNFNWKSCVAQFCGKFMRKLEGFLVSGTFLSCSGI